MTARAERLRDAVVAHPRLTAGLLVLLSAVVLLVRLSSPDRIVFDETYYVDDALGYLETNVEPSFAVHPTVGKWLIAAGIAVVGDEPVGWRVAAALAGVVTVLLTHLLARRLLAGRRWGPLGAVVAPLLLLGDGLFVVQSRIAMLDAFLVTMVVAGVLALVVDRDRRAAGTVRRWRPSVRWLAGIAFGLAIAVKWSGLLALGGAGLLVIAWELAGARSRTRPDGDAAGRRDRDVDPAPVTAAGTGIIGRALAVTGSLVLLPALVYGLTWAPWLASYEHTWAADCDDVDPVSDCEDATAPLTERLDGLWRYHVAMLDFHLGLESEHSYRSDPLGWVVLQRPVVYYWETCTPDRAAGVPVEDEDGELVPPEPCEVPVDTAGEILAVGNPAVWWGFLLCLPLLVAGAVRQDRRSAVPLVMWLALWVPWLLVSRAAFLFYLAPAVPFTAIGLVVAVDRLDHRESRLVTWVGTVAGAGVGLLGGLVVQTLGGAPDGWRPRLLGLAIGVGVGAVLGAGQDLRRDGRRPDGPGAAAPADDPDRGDRGGSDGGDGVAPVPVTPLTGPPSSLTPGGRAVTLLAAPPLFAPGDTAEATATDAGAPPRQGEGWTGRRRRRAATGAAGGPSRRPVTELARAGRVPVLLLAAVVLTWALWAFFSPVWYAVPLARDVLEWRWWFTTWI